MSTNSDVVSAEPSYRGLYIATVEQNNFAGTLHIGECRVRVNGMPGQTADVPSSSLPIAIFFRSQFNTQFGTFPIGATVVVSFQGGDPMAPIIEGRMLTSADKAEIAALFPEYESAYPNAYGWVDGKGTGFMVDSVGGTMKFIHKSGFNASVDSSGNVSIETPGDVSITNEGNTEVTTTGNVEVTATGDAKVEATGMLDLTSAVQIKLTAPMILEN